MNPNLLTVLTIELNIQNAYRLLVSESALILVVETYFGGVHLLGRVGASLLAGGTSFCAEGLVKWHLVGDKSLRSHCVGGCGHSCAILSVQKRSLIVFVGFSGTHVAWSGLKILVKRIWVRLLSVLLILVPLRVHRKWTLRILNLLHVHLIKWLLRVTLSELLWILLLLHWLMLHWLLLYWLLLPLNSWPIHDSRVIHPSLSIRASSWSCPRGWSLTLPWSLGINCWFEGTIFFLPLVLKVSRIRVCLRSISVELPWLIFGHLTTFNVNLRLEHASIILHLR